MKQSLFAVTAVTAIKPVVKPRPFNSKQQTSYKTVASMSAAISSMSVGGEGSFKKSLIFKSDNVLNVQTLEYAHSPMELDGYNLNLKSEKDKDKPLSELFERGTDFYLKADNRP